MRAFLARLWEEGGAPLFGVAAIIAVLLGLVITALW
jgi:hypothetical protein